MATGLVLSGGSVLGFAHIGLWRAIVEKNIKIDYVIGSSMGSIIAAAIALNIDIDYVESFVRKIGIRDISDSLYILVIKALLRIISKKPIIGFQDQKKVEKILRKQFGNSRFEDTKIKLEIPSVNIDTAEEIYYNSGDIVDAILDSTCIPGLFIPRSGNMDGLLRMNFPIERAVEKCDKIIGMCFGYRGMQGGSVLDRGIFEVLSQTFDIMSYEQTVSSIEYTRAMNKDVIIVDPKLYDIEAFDFSKVDYIIRRGYEESMRIIG